MTAEQILDEIFRAEGDEYTNHPADKGGPTRYGITQDTLSKWRGHSVSAEDVATLTKDEARAIYRKEYLEPWRLVLDAGLKSLLVDSSVQHGHGNAVTLLQRALRVTDDGIYGPETRDALLSCDTNATFRRLVGARMRFYGEIVSHDPKLKAAKKAGHRLQAENIFGWMNRLALYAEVP